MAVYPLTSDTVAKFHSANHCLAVHCPDCFRRAEIDLAAMIQRGEGDRRFATGPGAAFVVLLENGRSDHRRG